ncbi:PREDICTED: biorientation of chromosomes in cell division protein 1-like 1 [Habropoda laboriosa]|uniref:biorientation of chromosomes in cell division protein 1-like 1 n=1 Tax=Habropoda laboriosa TaxID=597456 RepID=UPI00083DB627|nr:PREDICTED: biorientation of chromosomes in cell division protein 1-like 1 [Habropoda laboriosa]
MSSKLEYLEKYSVAPSPSRDYYGLRVSEDQVTLYLWRISHGPHKTPLVRTSDFDDFNQDRQLQEEIRRIFGEYLLKHVKNIVSGNNNLLTLPKCLIERLIRYLKVQDIAKLLSLSHVSKEIFDDNFVWAALHKKYKQRTRNRYEEFYTPTYNWKQLFQLRHMQGLMNEQKMLRNRPTAKQTKANTKLENLLKANLKIENLGRSDQRIENLTRTFNSSFKAATKSILPENQVSKKSTDVSRRRNAQNPVPKKSSDRLEEVTNEKEKVSSEKKTLLGRSLQTGQKSIKAPKEQSIASKNDSKRETDKDTTGNKTAETKSNKIATKTKKIDTKSSNMSLKTTEEKSSTKSKNAPKVNKSEKPVSRLAQGDQTRPKMKGKSKKIGQSKSTILSTNTAFLSDHSAVRDDSFDLADLIEASLKNIRSPRSIFDYSFSCIEKSKSCGGDTKLQDVTRKMADHPRALKSGHIKASLDRLSEKSEPLTAKSIDSVGNGGASATPKCGKTSNADSKISTAESSKNRCKIVIPEGKVDHFERYGIYNKYPTPRMQDNVEQKKSTPRKEIDRMSVLRSFGSKVSRGKCVNPGATADVNRQEARKTVDSVYKYL